MKLLTHLMFVAATGFFNGVSFADTGHHSDDWQYYQAMKRARNIAAPMENTLRSIKKLKYFDLSACQIPIDSIRDQEFINKPSYLLMASDFSDYESVFKMYRIPKRYYRKIHDDFEKKWVERLSEYVITDLSTGKFVKIGQTEESDVGNDYYSDLDQLFEKNLEIINRIRPKGSPPIVNTVYCGGSDIFSYRLNFEPESASVQLISKWAYVVCRGRQKRLSFFQICKDWYSVTSGSEETVVGDLYYVADWPDRTRSTGFIRIRDYEIESILIKKSGVSYERKPR